LAWTILSVAAVLRQTALDGAFLLRTAKLARVGLAPLAAVALSLAGCAGPVQLYHNAEGGAIAQVRQPPPGADLPYPNLASVPPEPVGLTAGQYQDVAQRLAPVPAETPATQANPAALAGLALPAAPPPVPDVPGLDLPATPAPHEILVPPPAAAPATAPQASAPVSLAFRPGSAILSADAVKALAAIAQGRGSARILAGGFGEQAATPDDAALTLALERAQAIADALTAAGAPPAAIRLTAVAAGSGGFVQLVY
jgi:outer membrane protein OmpA-like peptidoglycan-associated protein